MINLICLLCFVEVVLSEEMAKDGYQRIMNVDISDILIKILIDKYKHMPQLQCKVLNSCFDSKFV
ncbi:hypothetical protein M758_1G230900 [Ceratodon purpureus]|nr:hypothetical protein M758_1G230900 [Ceratodon purpureus]